MQRKHIEYFYDGTPETFAIATAPATPYGSQRYDAFGRAVQTFDVDGTMTLKTVYHALSTDMWDAADLSAGPHSGTYASERKDGHGRSIRATERAHSGNTVQARHVLTSYSPTGQPEVITRRLGGTSASDVTRWMRYDTLGRMVLNVDPHTSAGPLDVPATDTVLAGYEAPENLRAWTYFYNYAGDLLGTEDARSGPKGRCGVGFTYDALGRLLGEDYFPCEAAHEDHSSALEVAYYYDGPPATGAQVPPEVCDPTAYPNGRLVTVRDRAAETTTCVDGRGRVIATARRIGTRLDAAENVSEDLTARYTGQWFYKKALYDAADRPIAETIGGVHGGVLSSFDGAWLDAFPGSEPQDAQAVVTNYSARGTVKSVGGSYGTLVAGITRRADGLVTNLIYGDSAGTQTSTTYDDRRRPTSIQTYRGTSALWSAFAAGGTPLPNITYSPAPSLGGTPTNFQLLLEDTDIAYDEVGNPIELRDWREPSEWPANNKPVTKKIEYDDLYRVRRMDYLYSTATGTDGFQSPYSRENTETDADWDKRRAKPAPHLSFTNRPLWQKFEYDWLGNLSETDDDAHGFYDRSIGTQSHANAGKPYQLSSATNSTQAVGGPAGNVTANYDVTGNLRRMAVARATTTARPCLPTGSGCNQYYAYDYDEVGRLVRARRWDAATAFPAASDSYLPGGDAQIELRYRYDASDQRVIKRVYKGAPEEQRHTLYVFGSLEVRRTAFAGDAYTISNESLVPYAMANGVRLARLHYSGASTSPQVAGTGLGEQAYRTNTAATLHVLLELGDHLGSTGTVLDKLTSELVEKTTYLPFGARENDYRGTDGAGGSNRWSSFREDYGFTGKEEDVEVGLTYFGKRFLSPQLGRWVTADPLAVHVAGEADFNFYAYVEGAVLSAIDPIGFAPEPKGFWGNALSAIGCGVQLGCSHANAPTPDDVKYGRVEPAQTKKEFGGELAMALAPVPRALRWASATLERRLGRVAFDQLERLGMRMSERSAASVARQLLSIERAQKGLLTRIEDLAGKLQPKSALRSAMDHAANTLSREKDIGRVNPADITGAISEKVGVELVDAPKGGFDHSRKVETGLQSLRNLSKSLDLKITHEVGRLERGLEGVEREATEKFLGELRSLKSETDAHVNAVRTVIREGTEAAK